MMKKGCLSEYFEAVAAKRLKPVEVDGLRSHQHEFNGITQFKQLFGDSKQTFDTKFIYLGEDEDDTVVDTGKITWYDAREKHPTRTEYRLYYQTNEMSDKVMNGDFLLICKVDSQHLVAVFAEGGSTIENQLRWLFGLSAVDIENNLAFKALTDDDTIHLHLISNLILDQLEIEAFSPPIEEKIIDVLIRKYGTNFPSTKEFSEFTRAQLKGPDSKTDPDSALIAWMDYEEALFRAFEEHLIGGRIRQGFKTVDEFMEFSLMASNRRKSRAGYAFENHLEYIFKVHKLHFDRNKITEGKSKPDFIFPSIIEYQQIAYPSERLFMLAVKTSCKDRWRQALAEARRITHKHLATLQPGISISQTDEMRTQGLKLVIPNELHASYSQQQQKELLKLSDFIETIRLSQN